MDRRHTDREYEGELETLRERVLLMGARVEEMLSLAMRSYLERSVELAQSTIELDRHIDQLELEIDELALQILARRQPVASDLRFITTTLKLVTDLERIGDLGVNICERVTELGADRSQNPHDQIARMADAAQGMVHDALDAFVAGDAVKANQVIDRDKRAIIATWDITGGTAPHTVAIDTAHHRLFVGARVKPGHIFKPGKMVVMDTQTGKVVAALDAEGGADEIQYDAASQRIYFTGTTGHVDVFKQLDADHYQPLGKLITAADAKTSLLVPELKRFYVAVPKRNVAIPPTRDVITEDAELLVFEVP